MIENDINKILSAMQDSVLSPSRINTEGWILVLKSAVAGMQFHILADPEEGPKVLETCTPGTELKLVREHNNRYDPWAIAIYTQDDQHLGYVTRYKNEAIARMMDADLKFHALVDKEVSFAGTQRRSSETTPTENYELPFSIYLDLKEENQREY